jgi:hypothetical protein
LDFYFSLLSKNNSIKSRYFFAMQKLYQKN